MISLQRGEDIRVEAAALIHDGSVLKASLKRVNRFEGLGELVRIAVDAALIRHGRLEFLRNRLDVFTTVAVHDGGDALAAGGSRVHR